MARPLFVLMAAATLAAQAPASAGIIADWNELQSRIEHADNGPPSFNAARFKASSRITIAMFEAANAVTPAYASYAGITAAPAGASDVAAVAAAAHAAMLAIYPDNKPQIDNQYRLELATVPAGAARDAGIAAGEAAAAAALKLGAHDQALSKVAYRPIGVAGRWAPSNLPYPAELTQGKPFVLKSPDELRLGPPPAITSAAWAEAFNEVKTYGGKTSTARSETQTAMARFFVDYSIDPLIRQLDSRPGKRLVDNAHAAALLSVALDDLDFVLIDGKMHWMSWRPMNAIRTAADDGNAATVEDAAWEPLLRTPNQPEYPCGHCGFAATVAGVLADELPPPPGGYAFSSDSLDGVVMRFPTLAAYEQAASDSRIYGGVHFRTTNTPSIAMGHALARLVRERFAPPLK